MKSVSHRIDESSKPTSSTAAIDKDMLPLSFFVGNLILGNFR